MTEKCPLGGYAKPDPIHGVATDWSLKQRDFTPMMWELKKKTYYLHLFTLIVWNIKYLRAHCHGDSPVFFRLWGASKAVSDILEPLWAFKVWLASGWQHLFQQIWYVPWKHWRVCGQPRWQHWWNFVPKLHLELIWSVRCLMLKPASHKRWNRFFECVLFVSFCVCVARIPRLALWLLSSDFVWFCCSFFFAFPLLASKRAGSC